MWEFHMRSEAEILLVSFATSNIVRLAEKYTKHGAKYLRDAGQITQREWRTIIWLERVIEPTLEGLSGKVGTGPKVFLPVIDGLIDRNLVVSITDNAGATRYTLTEAGDALFDKVYPVMEKRQRMLVEDEDPDEMALFMEMLHRLEGKVDASIEQQNGGGCHYGSFVKTGPLRHVA